MDSKIMTKFLKDIDLKGKVALITGATKGIGRSTAIAMHQVGASIVAIGRNKNELNSLKKKLRNRIQCIECDVNNYDKISNAINKIKKIDILVNNAGTNLPEPFLKVKKSSLETLLEVNTKAAFNIAKLCTDKMLEYKARKKIGASIIHTSSMFGLVAGPNRTVYSMTKFGIEGLTKGMAVDLAKFNIRVNSVCPTFVATPRAKKYLANKKFNKYALSNIPLGRIATESDVATAITFLSSNAASMITGTNLIIDGGWTAK
jgi:NAD(P)-dependent dehydrogenase (short-subunit alcohol dehydrogenase family)